MGQHHIFLSLSPTPLSRISTNNLFFLFFLVEYIDTFFFLDNDFRCRSIAAGWSDEVVFTLSGGGENVTI